MLSRNDLLTEFMAFTLGSLSMSAYRHREPSAEVPPDRYDGQQQFFIIHNA